MIPIFWSVASTGETRERLLERLCAELPVSGSGSVGPGFVLVAVDGAPQDPENFLVSLITGVVTFLPEHIPPVDAAVTAGFQFDVPVRFDSDQLEINLSEIEAGSIPHIPIVEIRP